MQPRAAACVRGQATREGLQAAEVRTMRMIRHVLLHTQATRQVLFVTASTIDTRRSHNSLRARGGLTHTRWLCSELHSLPSAHIM